MMVHMIEGTAMNLSFLMIEQIKIAAGKARIQACLPYGMVFTLIFMKVDIDLKGEDCKTLKHTDFYNIHTLHHMRLRKEGDVWVRRVEGAQSDAFGSSSSSPSNSAEPSSPVLVAGPSSPAPAPTLGSVAGEHHPGPLVSPHTLAMTHTFFAKGIIDQIMDRMESIFADFKSQILHSHDILLKDTQRQFPQLHGDLLRITLRL